MIAAVVVCVLLLTAAKSAEKICYFAERIAMRVLQSIVDLNAL